MKYSIDNLCETFQKHSEKFEKEKKMWNYDSEITDDDWNFNISEALKIICKEIQYLKNK